MQTKHTEEPPDDFFSSGRAAVESLFPYDTVKERVMTRLRSGQKNKRSLVDDETKGIVRDHELREFDTVCLAGLKEHALSL